MCLGSIQEMEEDGLVEITDDSINVTQIGYDFAQFITNYFDVYDPPHKTYNQRLETIKKAKDNQKKSLEYFANL